MSTPPLIHYPLLHEGAGGLGALTRAGGVVFALWARGKLGGRLDYGVGFVVVSQCAVVVWFGGLSSGVVHRRMCIAPDFLDTELSLFMQQLQVQEAAAEPAAA